MDSFVQELDPVEIMPVSSAVSLHFSRSGHFSRYFDQADDNQRNFKLQNNNFVFQGRFFRWRIRDFPGYLWYSFKSRIGIRAMHELGIAQNILEIVRQAVPENQEKSVRDIRIRVGQLSGIVPDSLDFCFTAIVNETDMQQASLAIEQVPTVSLCKSCTHRFEMDDWTFTCPVCRSTDLELISGRELEVVEIELADESVEEI